MLCNAHCHRRRRRPRIDRLRALFSTPFNSIVWWCTAAPGGVIYLVDSGRRGIRGGHCYAKLCLPPESVLLAGVGGGGGE